MARQSGRGDTDSSTGWTREQIALKIRELGEWFHNLELGGIQTAPNHFLGDYPTMKWRRFAHALPADLRGRTVLDVGCNAGFYALEMKRRGADRVIGIDTDETYLSQARFAADVCGLEIELRQLSVYDVAELGERFDLVLFMGVLYHLRHPLLALDLLVGHVVKDLLVVQSMLRGCEEIEVTQPDYPFSEERVFERPGFPRMSFIEHAYAGDATNWWVPNRAGLEAMLRSAGLELVSHPEAEVYLCRCRGVAAATDPGRSAGGGEGGHR